jgi:CrcB protein
MTSPPAPGKAIAMTPPSSLSASLYVAAGGAAGSWLRYLVGRAWAAAIGPAAASAFPWATLTVNIAGSLAMGLLVGWLARAGAHGESWRLLLGVGLLGGFTTFSSFSLEFALMVERGTIGIAALYVAASLIAGFAGLFAGLYLMRAAA